MREGWRGSASSLPTSDCSGEREPPSIRAFSCSGVANMEMAGEAGDGHAARSCQHSSQQSSPCTLTLKHSWHSHDTAMLTWCRLGYVVQPTFG